MNELNSMKKQRSIKMIEVSKYIITISTYPIKTACEDVR